MKINWDNKRYTVALALVEDNPFEALPDFRIRHIEAISGPADFIEDGRELFADWLEYAMARPRDE